jgi:hypothetical protein
MAAVFSYAIVRASKDGPGGSMRLLQFSRHRPRIDAPRVAGTTLNSTLYLVDADSPPNSPAVKRLPAIGDSKW